MATWSACILAGGKGRRLDGLVKPLVAVGGRTILSRQVETLAALGVRPALVAPDPAPFASLGLTVLPDDVAAGALGALYTAVARTPTPHVLVLAGDMPFITAEWLAFLVGLVADHDAVVPCVAGRWHPLCAVYHRRAAGRLRAAIDAGQWRVTDAVATLDVRLVSGDELRPFDPDDRVLLNVNTPDDHRRAAGHASP